MLERLEAVGEQERSTFTASFGPLTVGFDELIGLRLNEHGMHTWDVEVALDPSATLHSEQTALLIDNLGLLARYTAKPTGSLRTIAIRTTEPARDFVVDLAHDAVTFSAEPGGGQRPLVLPAEAFARLLYGRLDARPHAAIRRRRRQSRRTPQGLSRALTPRTVRGAGPVDEDERHVNGLTARTGGNDPDA